MLTDEVILPDTDRLDDERVPGVRFPRYPLLLPAYCALDIDDAADEIVYQARQRRSYAVTALAVHGLVESLRQPELGRKINTIQMIVPDGQPIVWALNNLYNLGLTFKVPGPALTLKVLEKAEPLGLGVYLYGSTSDTANRFKGFIEAKFPGVRVCGVHVDRFREASEQEDAEDIRKINESGAHIILVGRGCPRQEHWVADHVGKIDAAMLAVGAAFDYHSGNITRAPMWMQRAGLEWLYRLIQEPRRLFSRYVTTNSRFAYEMLLIKTGLKK